MMPAVPARAGFGVGLVGVLALLAPGGPAHSAEPFVAAVEFKDGVVTPNRIEAPAGVPIRIEAANAGAAAAEFESKDLRREKIIAFGGKVTISLPDLKPGEYQFFDDFHPEAKGVLVVK
jgi:hypothetical protein